MFQLKPRFALRRRVLRVFAASYIPMVAPRTPPSGPGPEGAAQPPSATVGVEARPPTQSLDSGEAVLLSVLIPTFNRAALLPAAVQSAVEGARGCAGRVDIWIIDDCSSDDTPAVCAQLRGSYPQVGYLRLRQNGGLARARNQGIAHSHSPYIALLDDDDLRLPGSFAPQIAALEANPRAALCYGPVQLADVNWVQEGRLQPERVQEGDLFWQLMEDNFIRVPSVVLRAGALDAVGHFDPELRRVEDQDRWVRLAHDYPFVAVAEPVAIYRQCDVASGQLSGDHAAMAGVSAALLERWLQLPRVQEAPAARIEAIRDRFVTGQVRLLRSTACQCLEAGMAAAARRDLRAAWKLDRAQAQSLGVPRLWLRSFFPMKAKRS